VHNIQPLLNHTYIRAASADGVYIRDEHGKVYLDGSSGAITCSIGHGNHYVAEAIRNQLDKLDFVYRSQFSSAPAEQLATRLHEISVHQQHAHTFFVNSGTEAMETAMKVALQYWQEQGKPEKQRFITRRKSYHGITMGALSLTGHPLRRQRFESLLEDYPQLLSDPESVSVEHQLKEFAEVVHRTGAHRVAAFVAEPLVGAAGAAVSPGPDYYSRIKELCNAHEILFIADEVMTGLGRTGKWFGLGHWDTVADIIAVGKSLGAGYAPIAATMLTAEVLDPIRRGSGLIMSGHTYSGHPLSCAAAIAVLDVVEKENLMLNVTQQGIHILRELESMQKRFPLIQHVRGKGLLVGLEFNPAIKGLQARVIKRCFENGLLVYPSMGGTEGADECGLLIAPPFIIQSAEVAELLEKLEQSIRQEMP